MAGDWIKMRPSLMTSPKVNGIARILERDFAVGRSLSTGNNGVMSEIVTRNVMRNVTVASLLVIWGAANEHTTDGVFRNADLSDLDDMVGIPGFGEAMATVGWAEYDAEEGTVILPNFTEYNTSGRERSGAAKTAAQRQKEYRERKRNADVMPEGDAESDVTSDVTRNRREEKRREENKTPLTPRDRGAVNVDRFQRFWDAYPVKKSKGQAEKTFAKLNPDDLMLNRMIKAIGQQIDHRQKLQAAGQFAPEFKHPSTWLNAKAWEDELEPIQQQRPLTGTHLSAVGSAAPALPDFQFED
jgi:hypothetical protein